MQYAHLRLGLLEYHRSTEKPRPAYRWASVSRLPYRECPTSSLAQHVDRQHRSPAMKHCSKTAAVGFAGTILSMTEAGESLADMFIYRFAKMNGCVGPPAGPVLPLPQRRNALCLDIDLNDGS
jgi:hypothetical protein